MNLEKSPSLLPDKTAVAMGSHCGIAATETLSLHRLFGFDGTSLCSVKSRRFQRQERKFLLGDSAFTLDVFGDAKSSCCFLRIAAADTPTTVRLGISGGYQIAACPSGGWLLKPFAPELPVYWIPQPFAVRALDRDGHILSRENAELVGFTANASELTVEVNLPAERNLDCVVWQFPAGDADIVAGLEQPSVLETQPMFLWSSHTVYRRPADVYLHLVHGHVYENHEVWPRYWRVCSELDAYALYVALSGLEISTGKRLYSLLKRQVVFSVIARQAEDGGWSHGEWTNKMEAHYRLHGGAMHLLAAALEEWPDDEVIRASLEKAAAYISGRSTQIAAGTWYLHDSLEQTPESAKLYPFRWVPTTAFGKSPNNMLVLNTHLDTMIALDRYREVTGDARYEQGVASARHAVREVLGARPAEWLYRPLFRAIGLTFLPTAEAAKLPLPVRAVKRLAWKYFIPWLPRIKAVFPRLVMPGGHIERALSQCSWSDQYQSVTLMDLLRYQRRFSAEDLGTAMDEALSFTQMSGIRERWKESREKGHALGFWAEALYHLCTLSPEPQYRQWLAEVILDVEDRGLGLSPSLLGANGEAMKKSEWVPCPSPANAALRVVNLGRGGTAELLVVNPTSGSLPLVWESVPRHELLWTGGGGAPLDREAPEVPARGWLWGRQKQEYIVAAGSAAGSGT